MKKISSKVFRKAGSLMLRLADRCAREPSELIKTGNERSLYKTGDGNLYWLNKTSSVDQSIIRSGVFERDLTDFAKRIIQKGHYVFDVGANIGYYSVIFSKCVGDAGKVFAFEPTCYYRNWLLENIKENRANNVEVYDFGLSDKEQQLVIDIGVSSASLHNPDGYEEVVGQEKITLKRLDSFVEESNPQRIDVIKIDIDGHEPLFLNGAWKAIDTYKPVIMMEISHLHYLHAGYTAWDFYDMITSRNYFIYHEKGSEIKSRNEFLMKCANFNASCNVILSHAGL